MLISPTHLIGKTFIDTDRLYTFTFDGKQVEIGKFSTYNQESFDKETYRCSLLSVEIKQDNTLGEYGYITSNDFGTITSTQCVQDILDYRNKVIIDRRDKIIDSL